MGLWELMTLAAVCTYGLPLYEAVTRRSAFYTVVFSCVLLVSAVRHCEETGVCSAFAPGTHARLASLSGGVSIFLAGLMVLVVLEIRNEVVGRVLMGLWACAATLRDPHDLWTNGVVTLVLGGLILLADVTMFKRRFSPAFWRRLGLILAMAGVGGLLFRLVHASLRWHAVWHIYLATTVYLLLLAQRTKRMLAAKAGAKRASGGAGHSNSTGFSQLTTPVKRRAGSGGVPVGAAAAPIDELDGGASGPSASGKEPGSEA